MNILLTGGLGYIGSHTALALLADGHNICIYDNLVNSDVVVLESLNRLSGIQIPFREGDIRDSVALSAVLVDESIDAVVHFAGLKAVGESVIDPLSYYENNVYGFFSASAVYEKALDKKKSSSVVARVFMASPFYTPINELHPLSPCSPYAQTKKQVEEMMVDVSNSEDGWQVVLLRYFNPVGAHESGLIGENPSDMPNNLVPFLAKVANGELSQLYVYGDDYGTRDGTGVRDYIHVTDLAKGHAAALMWLNGNNEKLSIFNLGTGIGTTVLEMVDAYSRAASKEIPYSIADRRPGDVAVCFADNTKALEVLKWKPTLDINNMCDTSWSFSKSEF